jgi:DNA-3-methyladenine glycosylase II
MRKQLSKNKTALSELIKSDNDLHRIYQQVSAPDFWYKSPGFTGLLRIILEQQVSLASGRAMYHKLSGLNGRVTVDSFLELSIDQLRHIGFSRQKIAYSRMLAISIRDGELDLNVVAMLPDREVRNVLIKFKGVGEWTVHCYLIFCLDRADIWPSGDLALNKALKVVKKLDIIPDKKMSEMIAGSWKPYRSVAARLLWHYYLSPVFPILT